MGHDKNGNTKVEVKVEHLATPENLTPPRTAYVVWFKERDAEPLNQGLLKPGKDLKATFRSVTPLKTFDVVITAESDPNTKRPLVPRSCVPVFNPNLSRAQRAMTARYRGTIMELLTRLSAPHGARPSL